jgi:hypothetical protein
MTESPFVTINKIINEAPETYTVLRIIAKDEHKLTKQDRDSVNRGAEELETYARALVYAHALLIERGQEVQSLRDANAALQKQIPKPMFPTLSLYSGPRQVNLQINNKLIGL